MRITIPILVLMLSLSLLMTLPGTYTGVRAQNQSGPTKFAPFGPFTQQMIIHYYSDFDVMFQHFLNGEIDISDWQLQSPTDVGTFCSNPDFWCTSAEESLGYFGLVEYYSPEPGDGINSIGLPEHFDCVQPTQWIAFRDSE